MKKLLTLAFVMMIILTLAACGDDNNEESSSDVNGQEETDGQEDTFEENDTENSQESTEDNGDSDRSEEMISLTFDDGEQIVVSMYDNPTSREFLDRLPLELTFEEFGGFEKLSYLDEELTTEEAPSGYEPGRGDFSYFSPWGNIAMFYDDHRFSDGLVQIGEIESGVELMDDIDEDFEVSIEMMD